MGLLVYWAMDNRYCVVRDNWEPVGMVESRKFLDMGMITITGPYVFRDRNE